MARTRAGEGPSRHEAAASEPRRHSRHSHASAHHAQRTVSLTALKLLHFKVIGEKNPYPCTLCELLGLDLVAHGDERRRGRAEELHAHGLHRVRKVELLGQKAVSRVNLFQDRATTARGGDKAASPTAGGRACETQPAVNTIPVRGVCSHAVGLHGVKETATADTALANLPPVHHCA